MVACPAGKLNTAGTVVWSVPLVVVPDTETVTSMAFWVSDRVRTIVAPAQPSTSSPKGLSVWASTDKGVGLLKLPPSKKTPLSR